MSQLKKEKDIAGILALLFGFIGLHRFYLGQRGKGILYLLLVFTGISLILGLIDAFTFFSMDNKTFDIKYNRDFLRVLPKKEFEKSVKNKTEERNTFVKSGKLKFLSYDYDGAIVDFSKALELNPREIAAHFNIACAYSLNENVEKALFHLDKAILYGFDDFEKLKNHDALAFIRVQPAYINFVKNGFSFSLNESKDLNTKNTENIEKLEELRLRGLLTEEEFTIQKMKISRL
jgi:TM2 domain-containing membrane protein YozV